MFHFFHQLTLPYNLPYTLGVTFVVIYWLISLFGVVTTDLLNWDIDTPDATDLDSVSGSTPVSGSSFHWLSPFISVLRFVNGAEIPLVIVGSVLMTVAWYFCSKGNAIYNPEENLLTGWGICAISGLLALPATKLLTLPLLPFFRKIKESEKSEPILGQKGTVISLEVNSRYGQVEVPRKNGAPASISCVSIDGATFPRGCQVHIQSYDAEKDLYLVISID